MMIATESSNGIHRDDAHHDALHALLEGDILLVVDTRLVVGNRLEAGSLLEGDSLLEEDTLLDQEDSIPRSLVADLQHIQSPSTDSLHR